MNYFDKYKSRVHAAGQNEAEIQREYLKKSFDDGFCNSPNYRKSVIDNVETDSRLVTTDKENEFIIILPSSSTVLHRGSIVEFDGRTWLATDYFDNDLYPKGKIQLCQSTINWLNDDGFVKTTPLTLLNDSLSNFGVQDGRVLSMPNERRQIIIQSNDDTNNIKKNQRFLFDGRAWKVTALNSLIDGIIHMTLEEELVNNTNDNLELRIADYYGRAANFTLNILNGNQFSIQAGKTIQLNVEVLNNGSVSDEQVEFESSDSSIATVSSTGIVTSYANGTVVITAKLIRFPSISDTISGTIEFATTHNYTIELDTMPSIIVNTSKTITAIIKDNSTIDSSRTVMWYLLNKDGVELNTDVATITMSSTTQCTLKGLKVGKAKLKVVLVGSYPQIYSLYDVKITSLV